MQNLFADMGSPDYTKLSGLGQSARAYEQAMGMQSDAMVAKAGDDAEALKKMAEYNASATKAQGDAAMQGAMGSALGSIGGMIGGAIPSMSKGTTASPLAFDGSKMKYDNNLTFGGMTPSQVLQSPNIGYNIFGGN